jgi:hypothetical protein
MALQTEHGEVIRICIRPVFIDVMKLYSFPPDATDAACAVGSNEDRGALPLARVSPRRR